MRNHRTLITVFSLGQFVLLLIGFSVPICTLKLIAVSLHQSVLAFTKFYVSFEFHLSHI